MRGRGTHDGNLPLCAIRTFRTVTFDVSQILVEGGSDRLLPIQPDVCQRLNAARSTVYELIYSKELRSVKLGRRRMVRESDLQAFIASLDA